MHIAPASRCFRERYGRGLPARQSVSGPKRHYFALYSQQEGVRTRGPQHPRESHVHVHVRHAPASPPLGIIHLRRGVVGIIDLQGQNKRSKTTCQRMSAPKSGSSRSLWQHSCAAQRRILQQYCVSRPGSLQGEPRP
jgi:hypothetical protein